MADGNFLWVCKAAGTEYTAGSTVNSAGDEHESYLLIWLHGNNGRDTEQNSNDDDDDDYKLCD